MAFSRKNESLIYHTCMIIRQIQLIPFKVLEIWKNGIYCLNLILKCFHDRAQHWVFFTDGVFADEIFADGTLLMEFLKIDRRIMNYICLCPN